MLKSGRKLLQWFKLKKGERFGDQYDMVVKEEVRNKDPSRFPAWVTNERKMGGVLQTKKVKKREQYKNANVSTLQGYYMENVAKIAI